VAFGAVTLLLGLGVTLALLGRHPGRDAASLTSDSAAAPVKASARPNWATMGRLLRQPAEATAPPGESAAQAPSEAVSSQSQDQRQSQLSTARSLLRHRHPRGRSPSTAKAKPRDLMSPY